MKKLILFSILLTVLAISAMAQNQTTNQTPIKIGYVDSETILKALPEAIKAQGELDALISKWNSQVDSMTAALQQAYQDYQKQSTTMKEDKKLAAQQVLVQQQQAIEEFRRLKFAQGTGEVYKKQEELLKPVKEKVFSAIETVAKNEGMQFIFDKTGDIILLYAHSDYDITFKVLDFLKRGK